MDRRSEFTPLRRSSNDDSGVDVNTFRSTTSQLAADEVQQIVESQDIEDVEANIDDVEANVEDVEVNVVQESMNTEDDIDVHPTGAVGVIFRAVGDQISALCYVDVDVQLAKALLETFRQLLLAVERCWTCFDNRRGVINTPCMCFCNCQACAEVMSLCSMCGRRIDDAIPAVFQYVA